MMALMVRRADWMHRPARQHEHGYVDNLQLSKLNYTGYVQLTARSVPSDFECLLSTVGSTAQRNTSYVAR
jgi:hypothetical protein